VDAAPLPNKGPGLNTDNPQVMCVDERVTVKAKSVSQDKILDSIAKACRLKIHSASAVKSRTLISADFTGIALADALGELLRGCDYLVVYNETRENTGFVASVAQIRSAQPLPPSTEETADADAVNEPVMDEKEVRVDFLRNQIEVLNERIASGASDRFYEEAIKNKPPEFVQNDRQELAQFQEQLSALQQ
jgi:hypothetical protein